MVVRSWCPHSVHAFETNFFGSCRYITLLSLQRTFQFSTLVLFVPTVAGDLCLDWIPALDFGLVTVFAVDQFL